MVGPLIFGPDGEPHGAPAFDAERLAGDSDPEAMARILDDVAMALQQRRPPSIPPALVVMVLSMAAAVVRGTVRRTPATGYGKTPDEDVLRDAADRLAEPSPGMGAADLVMAATLRRVADELAYGMLATRAARDVWDMAATHAAKGLTGPPAGRQRFFERMRAEGRRRWPNVPEARDVATLPTPTDPPALDPDPLSPEAPADAGT